MICPPILLELKAIPTTKYPYRSAVGSLLYVASFTRPDISMALSCCSKFLENPKLHHIVAVKRIFRYLNGTRNVGIVYSNQRSGMSAVISMFSDASFASDPDKRRSRHGFVCLFNGAAITWQSQLTSTIPLSSTESELYGAVEAAKELLNVKKFVFEIAVNCEVPTLFLDNTSTLKLCDNPINPRRTKHVELRLFAIRDWVQKGEFKLEWVKSEDQAANFLTKGVPISIFNSNLSLISIE